MAHTYVFPAHAGMSRPRFILAPGIRCFPRPRGDEPLSRDQTRSRRGFSPPTRG